MIKEFVEFVKQSFPSESFVPLHRPILGETEKRYLNECIDSQFVSSAGPHVSKVEERLADQCGSKHAVAVVNGTEALHLALGIVGTGPGDLVVTQAFSFVATANAISYCGADPAFIDIEEESLGIDPSSLKKFFTGECEVKGKSCFHKASGRKVAACIPVHIFGHASRIEEISLLCREHSVALVEDAAEALGSTLKGKSLGTFGVVSAMSFNGNKIATAGGGGVILTDDESIAKLAKHKSTTAKLPHKWEYRHDMVGYNYRMPNLNAALLCAQLDQLSTFVDAKRKLALRYADFFSTHDIRLLLEREGSRSNYWLNAVFLKDLAARNKFLEETNSAGVMTRPAWEPSYTLPMFKHCYRDSQQKTQDVYQRLVNIPSSVPLNAH